MNTNIIESFKWLTPEFTVAPTDGKTVKIRGKAIPRETVSRNNKKYVDEELRKAARTFIDVPITENHKNWTDKKNQLGKVNWMEYDDGSMEYVAEVWNPEMASELRLYAKNPSASKVRGVSVEADFLKIACTKCKQEFLTETDWRRHMETVEHIHDLPLEPHGIRGRALSIVTGHESPGVVGNTLEVLETVSPLLRLLESVIKLSKEREKMNGNMVVVKEVQSGPPYSVKEQQEEPPKKEEEKPKKPDDEEEDEAGEEEEEEKQKPAIETVKLKPLIKEVAPRMKLGEPFASYSDFEDCVSKNSDKDDPEAYCGRVKKEAEETVHFRSGVVGKVNEIVEAWNNLRFPEDDKSWVQQIKQITETVNLTKQALTEMIKAIPPDNLGWIDAEAKLLETMTSGLKKLEETVAAIPKDDLGWNDKIKEVIELLQSKFTSVGAELLTVTNSIKSELTTKLQETISTFNTSIETMNKTLLENLAQMTQKTSLVETKLSMLEADNKTLKEAVEKQQLDNAENKKVYELNLAAYEKDIKEYWKPLATQNALEISKLRLDLDGEKEKTKLAETEKKKTLTEMENMQDKIQPNYKAHAKTTVKEPSTVSSFNPYS